MKPVIRLLNKPFDLLESLRMRMLFAIGMGIFCTFFLYLFSPFNIISWIGYLSPFRSFALVGLLAIGCLAILFSQLLQTFLWRKQPMIMLHLLLGYLLDALFLIVSLGILYRSPDNPWITNLFQTARMVIPILFLYYLVGLNLLALLKLRREQKASLQKAESFKEEPVLPERINITDENGQLRLSLKPDDLLYIESADNYVLVYFRKEQRIVRELIRNSLKNMEEMLAPLGSLRCHRSYLVNREAIHCLRKSGRTYEIEISGMERTVPVSRGYVELVKEALEI